jgi:hypothetical protein
MYTLTGWRRIALLVLNVVLVVVSFVALVYDGYRAVRDRYDARQPVAARVLEYRVYTDPKDHYSIALPAGFDTVQPAPDAPKSSVAFASGDGQGRVTSWARVSEPSLTPGAALAACKQATTTAGGIVNFTFTTDRFFVCSGKTRTGDAFYERGVIGTNRSYYFRWEYSQRWRKVYEPAVQQAVDSFTPGPLNVIKE